jgi:hypothetical protein
MKKPDVYTYVWNTVRKMGFKRDNFRIFYLADVVELTISEGNTVSDMFFEFNIALTTKREPNRHWGGDISTLKLDNSYDENILYPVFNTWLESVLASEELKLYTRSVKIKRICSKLEI